MQHISNFHFCQFLHVKRNVYNGSEGWLCNFCSHFFVFFLSEWPEKLRLVKKLFEVVLLHEDVTQREPYGHRQSPLVIYGPAWSRNVLCGRAWSLMVPYNFVCSHIVLYGYLWSCMVTFGPVLATHGCSDSAKSTSKNILQCINFA